MPKQMKKVLREDAGEQAEEMRDLDEDGTDVLVHDYSDMEIEMLKTTRKNFLT